MAGAAIVGGAVLVTGIYSAEQQRKGEKERNKAQKKANAIERRRSEISNQRERRMAAASTQSAVAQNMAMGEAYGSGGSSTILGANIGLQSQLASAVGYSNTMLAANSFRNDVLQKGQDRYAKYMGRAGYAAAVGNTVQTGAQFI